MSEFNVGDLVEARKGERVIRDRIYAGTNEFRYLGEPSVFGPSSVAGFRDQGFTLSLVEAATPTPLPSEAGLYFCSEQGDEEHLAEWHFDSCRFHYLNTEGKWCDLGWGAPTDSDLPLTKVEPVPDTARKIIAEIGAWAFGPCTPEDVEEIGELITRLEKTFGVSS